MIFTYLVLTCIYYVFFLIKNFLLGLRAFVLPNNVDLVKKYGSWAVVTGATDGIGLAYAKELAARKVNIVLISRTEEKLKRVASEIENEFSIKTKIISADFSKGRPIYKHIENELKDVPVGILVNNVGMSLSYPLSFTEMSEDLIWDMVNVNVAPVLFMTKMVLPEMKKIRKGAIINVSSLAELHPIPSLALYSATKTFIRNFTKALQYENRGYGLTIQILSPYIVDTKVTKLSHHILLDSLIKPTTTDYTRQAIRSLGIMDHTAGYVPHCIIMTLAKFIPESLRSIISAFIFRIVSKSPKKTE